MLFDYLLLTRKALKVGIFYNSNSKMNGNLSQKDKKEALDPIAWTWDRTVYHFSRSYCMRSPILSRGRWQSCECHYLGQFHCECSRASREPLSMISTQLHVRFLTCIERGVNIPCQYMERSRWTSGRGLFATCKEAMLWHRWHKVKCDTMSSAISIVHREFIYPPGCPGDLWLVGYK